MAGLLAFSLLVGLAVPGISFARGIEKMTLYVGEVKVLAIKKVDRVAVGNGSLLSTSITEKEMPCTYLARHSNRDSGEHACDTHGTALRHCGAPCGAARWRGEMARGRRRGRIAAYVRAIMLSGL